MPTDRKAGFLSALRSEDLDGGRKWKLLEPLRYYSAILAREIVLDAGFVADSYSAPRDFIGSWIVRDIDRRPAFVHDKLYAARFCTREQADKVLLEAMESVGISWWRSRLIYAGVRVGGGLFWPDDPAPSQDPHSEA